MMMIIFLMCEFVLALLLVLLAKPGLRVGCFVPIHNVIDSDQSLHPDLSI